MYTVYLYIYINKYFWFVRRCEKMDLDECFAVKVENFDWCGIHKLSEVWEKFVSSIL